MSSFTFPSSSSSRLCATPTIPTWNPSASACIHSFFHSSRLSPPYCAGCHIQRDGEKRCIFTCGEKWFIRIWATHMEGAGAGVDACLVALPMLTYRISFTNHTLKGSDTDSASAIFYSVVMFHYWILERSRTKRKNKVMQRKIMLM